MKNKHNFAQRSHAHQTKTNNTLSRLLAADDEPFNRTAAGRAWDVDDDLKDRVAKRNFSFKRLTLALPIVGALVVLGISLKNSFANTVFTARQNSGSYVFFDSDLSSDAISSLYTPSVATVPSTFSLANTYSLPVENQGEHDACVLFATNKAAETNYVLTHSGVSYLNLSERYLDYYTSSAGIGSRTVGSSVANRVILTALETKGTPLESDFTYTDHTADEIAAATPALRVTNTVAFPSMSSVSDKAAWRNILKLHIMKYGAITADLVAPNSTTGNYNPATFAYNYTGTDNPDHDVAIIGWDDDFAASNFTNQPSSNGAFIAINSWGAWGKENTGIFYISYESAKFLDYPFGVLSTEVPTSSYTVNTEDHYLFTTDYTPLDKKLYGVVLDVEGTEQYLSHIGFGLGSQSGAAVNIYLNPVDGSFDTNKLILLEQKQLDYSQNAISLKNPIKLTGTKYALVFEYTGENLAYSAANRSVNTLGTPNTFLSGAMYTADALASTWDATEFQFPVFAYTSTRTVSSVELLTAPTQTVYSVGQAINLTGLTFRVTYSDGTTSVFTSDDATLAITGYNPATTGIQAITATYLGTYPLNFNVVVTDAEAVIAWDTLPTKRTYAIGDPLNLNGGIIKVTYPDANLYGLVPLTSSDITVTGYDPTTAGTQVLTVTYLDKTLTYDVVVGVIDDTPETPSDSSDPDDLSSADETADKAATEAQIKAPNTGVFTTVTVAAASESIFLPVAIIVIFGGLLTYDLIRKH